MRYSGTSPRPTSCVVRDADCIDVFDFSDLIRPVARPLPPQHPEPRPVPQAQPPFARLHDDYLTHVVPSE